MAVAQAADKNQSHAISRTKPFPSLIRTSLTLLVFDIGIRTVAPLVGASKREVF
jgi:hypothetical protein